MPGIVAKYTRVFGRTQASHKRVVINVGGARSSKSYSVAQLLVYKFLTEEKKTIIIARKTFPALRATAMRTVLEILQDWGAYQSENHNKTEHVITNPRNGSEIRFISIEDPTRVRSMEANYVWLEEANEFTFEDFITLRTRLSAPSVDGRRNQMFLTLNPSDTFGWINQRLVPIAASEREEDKDEVEVIHSTYLDNPTLQEDYVRTLLRLKDEDDTYFKVFTLGEWATPQQIIYSNYEIVAPSKFPADFDEKFGGLDFGFNNPASAIFVGVKDKEAWIKEIVYQSHLTNSELIDHTKREYPLWKQLLWRADEAEPDRIEEFSNAGFNIEPAKKGANSLRDGIDFCKRMRWHISSESVNVIKEVRGYKWREKDGLVLDEPVKFLDHSMDAIRYALTGLKSYSDPQGFNSTTAGARPARRKFGAVGDPRRYGKSYY